MSTSGWENIKDSMILSYNICLNYVHILEIWFQKNVILTIKDSIPRTDNMLQNKNVQSQPTKPYLHLYNAQNTENNKLRYPITPSVYTKKKPFTIITTRPPQKGTLNNLQENTDKSTGWAKTVAGMVVGSKVTGPAREFRGAGQW